MATLATLQTYLANAEDALNQLCTGQQVVEFDRGGTKVRYTPAQATQLRQYISELKNQIAVAGGGGRRRGIIYNYF